MGSHRSCPTDSDNNPKLVHVSYDQAKAKDGPEGTGAGGKLIVEKTDQVMGSCAGAGYVAYWNVKHFSWTACCEFAWILYQVSVDGSPPCPLLNVVG